MGPAGLSSSTHSSGQKETPVGLSSSAHSGGCNADAVNEILDQVRIEGGWDDSCCAVEKAAMLASYLRGPESRTRTTCSPSEVRQQMMTYCGPKEGTCVEQLPQLFAMLKGEKSKTEFCEDIRNYDPHEEDQSLAQILHHSFVKINARNGNRQQGGFLCEDGVVEQAVNSYCEPFRCSAEAVANLLKGAGFASNEGLKALRRDRNIDAAVIDFVKMDQGVECTSQVVSGAIEALAIPPCTTPVIAKQISRILMEDGNLQTMCGANGLGAEVTNRVIKWAQDKGDTCTASDIGSVVSTECKTVACSVENVKAVVAAPKTLIELKRICTNPDALDRYARGNIRTQYRNGMPGGGCLVAATEARRHTYTEALCACSPALVNRWLGENNVGVPRSACKSRRGEISNGTY